MITTEAQKQEVVVPEGAILIDEVFYVWKTRYGLYSTMTKEGWNMLTGGTKDGVVSAAPLQLKEISNLCKMKQEDLRLYVSENVKEFEGMKGKET